MQIEPSCLFYLSCASSYCLHPIRIAAVASKVPASSFRDRQCRPGPFDRPLSRWETVEDKFN